MWNGFFIYKQLVFDECQTLLALMRSWQIASIFTSKHSSVIWRFGSLTTGNCVGATLLLRDLLKKWNYYALLLYNIQTSWRS